MDPQVVMNLTRATNRLALVLEKQLAFDQEQAALREREAERRKTPRRVAR